MSVLYGIKNGDIAPRPRSGHVATFYQGQMLIYGGISGDYAAYHPASELWSYSTETALWTALTTKGQPPGKGLSGSCATRLREYLILFGGFEERVGPTSRVHCLDLKTLTWIDLSSKVLGNAPSKRDKLCCWTYGMQIVFFGGYGHMEGTESSSNGEFIQEVFPDGVRQGLGWNSHVYVLNCSDINCLNWSQPEITGDIPCPRAAHSSTTVGSIGYLFGGRFQQLRRNDLYSFDLKTYHWEKIKNISGPVPKGRSWHILEALSDKHLLLFGGLSTTCEPLSDFWVFELENHAWRPLINRLSDCEPRLWHTSTTTDEKGEVLIFGGCTNSLLSAEPLLHSNAVLVVRVSPLTLRRLCLDYIMTDFPSYKDSVPWLPRTLQKLVEMREHAMQFCMNSETAYNHTSTCSTM